VKDKEGIVGALFEGDTYGTPWTTCNPTCLLIQRPISDLIVLLTNFKVFKFGSVGSRSPGSGRSLGSKNPGRRADIVDFASRRHCSSSWTEKPAPSKSIFRRFLIWVGSEPRASSARRRLSHASS